MSSNFSVATSDHGELKRRIAEMIGSDPSRYGEAIGTERHKYLLKDEIEAITEAFGMGLKGEPKEQQKDAIMIRLGRDHRTGVSVWDTSDLIAVVEALEAELEVDDAE